MPDPATDTQNPVQTPTPTPAPAATDTSTPSAQPAPTSAPAQAAPPRQSFVQGMQSQIPSYGVNDEGQISSNRPPTTPTVGGVLGGILMGALQGAQRGMAATTPEGAKGRGAALSAGASAAEKGALAADERARKIAADNFQRKQEAVAQKVRTQRELAETAHIAQNMSFEKEEHPGVMRAKQLEIENLELAHQGAMDRLNEDAFKFSEELAQHGAPPEVFLNHSPQLTAQLPGFVSGDTIPTTNGVQGKGAGINTWHAQDLNVPLTGKPIVINRYDKGLDKDGAPIPNPTVFTPDGKTTLMDVKKAYFEGRRQLYQTLQQHEAQMTQAENKAKVNKENQQAKQAAAEAGKASAEGEKAKTENEQLKQFLIPTGGGGTDAAGGTGGVAANATGQSFLQSLPPAIQDTLKAVYEGREQRSPRQFLDKNGNPTPFTMALNRAYPDFNVANAMNYGKQVTAFTSGKEGQQLERGATATGHLADLRKLNQDPTSRIIGTPAYIEYNDLAHRVAGELTAFLGEPSTNESIQRHIDDLTSLTFRDAAITREAKAMKTKKGELAQQWTNGAPSKSFIPPMPKWSPAADAALANLTGASPQSGNLGSGESGNPDFFGNFGGRKGP